MLLPFFVSHFLLSHLLISRELLSFSVSLRSSVLLFFFFTVRCGNVNWERRKECNVCGGSKPGLKVEERTGRGGGFDERQPASVGLAFFWFSLHSSFSPVSVARLSTTPLLCFLFASLNLLLFCGPFVSIVLLVAALFSQDRRASTDDKEEFDEFGRPKRRNRTPKYQITSSHDSLTERVELSLH